MPFTNPKTSKLGEGWQGVGPTHESCESVKSRLELLVWVSEISVT